MRGPGFPEFEYTPEERVKAVAEILLRGMRRMLAERRRAKKRGWRERTAATVADSELEAPRDASRHPDEEDS